MAVSCKFYNSRLLFNIFPCSNSFFCKKICSHQKRNYSTSNIDNNIGEVFMKSDVQSILKRITGFNLERVFHERQTTDLKPAKYHLLTDDQLIEAQKDAVKRGYERLQFPPILPPRNDVNHVLSDDKEIAGFSDQNYVFTDISYDVPDTKRLIVVRENTGLLRKANADERERMIQVYFPRQGRSYKVPEMFSDSNLEKLLQTKSYEYILDRACLQFEPDDHLYISVVERTYEHIADQHDFDALRSTRHFAGLAFYLTRVKRSEPLMSNQIQQDLIMDAADMVRLYHLLHPKCESKQQTQLANTDDPIDLIELYLKYDSKQDGIVALALQNYAENLERVEL